MLGTAAAFASHFPAALPGALRASPRIRRRRRRILAVKSVCVFVCLKCAPPTPPPLSPCLAGRHWRAILTRTTTACRLSKQLLPPPPRHRLLLLPPILPASRGQLQPPPPPPRPAMMETQLTKRQFLAENSLPGSSRMASTFAKTFLPTPVQTKMAAVPRVDSAPNLRRTRRFGACSRPDAQILLVLPPRA